ncbi:MULTISPECIES: hypothetical protein [unclassified Chryseobacterium]|nr:MULTISPECIES: hypothetical protein [unclassified Chryseobacterium]PXW14300.1 hypothetical protein C8D70_1072 [Chryseobacterium sp. CBTAP 102]
MMQLITVAAGVGAIEGSIDAGIGTLTKLLLHNFIIVKNLVQSNNYDGWN